jgi:hypothetical protein
LEFDSGDAPEAIIAEIGTFRSEDKWEYTAYSRDKNKVSDA